MYKIVATVLYEEPIVQNIGLFFLGIEQPSQDRNESDDQANIISHSETENGSETGTEGSIPYHKRHLLDLVKKLHIIRASSNTPLDKYYIEHPTTPYLFYGSDLQSVKCDRLARAEIEGWLLAESLLKRLAAQPDSKVSWESASPLISFRRLTALTFGLWDDGRWEVYEDKSQTREDLDNRGHRGHREQSPRSDGSDEEGYCTDKHDKLTSAYLACEQILSPFFVHTLAHQPVSLCHHTDFGHSIFERRMIAPGDIYRSLDSRLCHVEGLRVIHGYQETECAPGLDDGITNAGPTRIFVRYSQDEGYDGWSADRIHEHHIASFRKSIDAYMKCLPDRLPDQFHADTTFRLDFCVLLDTEDPNTRPDKAQIRKDIEAQQIPIAEQIKAEQRESDSLKVRGISLWSWRAYRKALLLRMIPYDIHVGDDVPSCPACGLKE